MSSERCRVCSAIFMIGALASTADVTKPECRLWPANCAGSRSSVADLVDDGHDDGVLPEAEHLLEAMRATQAALEVHLDLEEREAGELRQARRDTAGQGAMGAAQGGGAWGVTPATA